MPPALGYVCTRSIEDLVAFIASVIGFMVTPSNGISGIGSLMIGSAMSMISGVCSSNDPSPEVEGLGIGCTKQKTGHMQNQLAKL